MFFKAGQRRQRRKIMNNHTLIFDRRESFFPQAPNHAVDMWYAEAEHISDEFLSQRQGIT